MNRTPFHAAVIQAAWSAVGSVPGCRFAHLSPGARFHPDPNVASIVVGVSGWSPTLHGVEIEYELTIEAPSSSTLAPGSAMPRVEDQPGVENAVVEALAHPLSLQKARASRAAREGIPTPLDASVSRPGDLSHIHLDASHAALVIERSMHHGQLPGDAMRSFLSLNLASLHREAVDHPGGHSLASETIDTHDHDGRSTAAFLTDLLSDERFAHDGIGASMKGARVSVSGMVVPDTALLAAIGRPFGDLINLHPYLDHRIVAAARTTDAGGGGFLVTLERDPRRLGDFQSLGAHEALEHLGFAPIPAP
jgi:hypothetical protein